MNFKISQLSQTSYTASINIDDSVKAKVLGNSIRRVVLGYARGYAITHIQFKEIKSACDEYDASVNMHHYQHIGGLSINIIEILYKFKEVEIDLKEDTLDKNNSYYCFDLKIKGPSSLYASDLENASTSIKIYNKNLHLFNIVSDDFEAILTIYVQLGCKNQILPIKPLESDTNTTILNVPMPLFNPVEHCFFDFNSDEKKLIINFTTNGYSRINRIIDEALKLLNNHCEALNQCVDNMVMLNQIHCLSVDTLTVHLTDTEAEAIRQTKFKTIGELIDSFSQKAVSHDEKHPLDKSIKQKIDFIINQIITGAIKVN